MSTHDNTRREQSRNEKVANARLDNPRPLRSTPDTYGHWRTGLQYDKFNPRLATSSDVITCLAVLKFRVDTCEGETTGKRDPFRDEAALAVLDRFTVFYAQIFITLPLTAEELSSVLIKKKPRRVAINGTWKGGCLFISPSSFLSP